MRSFFERFVVLLFCTGLLAISVHAAQSGADPSVNQPYQSPRFEQWVQRFERPGREVYDQREQILAAAGIERGMDVADVGAGTGLFTLLFAERVGEDGTVYAVDVSRPFIEQIERRAREHGLSNVRTVVNSQRSVELPADAVDLVFMSDTYHHFEHPGDMLASIHEALRPQGELVVIDFRREPGVSSHWILQHVRAGQSEVVEEITAAGFELVDEADFLQENYLLRFRKRDRS